MSKSPKQTQKQLSSAREVMERRREALRQLAFVDQIMSEDSEILRTIAKN